MRKWTTSRSWRSSGSRPPRRLAEIINKRSTFSSLFKDVAHEYVHTAMSPEQVRHLIDRAFRIAHSQRTVTCLIFPKDVQEMDSIETPAHEHDTIHTSVSSSTPRIVPEPEDLQRAAEVLNSGHKVAILVGAGAAGATDEVVFVAERLAAGIAKALLGRNVVPDHLPFVTGSIGLLGTKPSWDMMNDCDTLLMVGSSFPYSEFLPKEGKARGVQIDIDPRMLGLRYPMEVALVGDSAETLRALLPLLKVKKDGKWRSKIERATRDWSALMEERAHVAADPVNPELVFWHLSRRLPDDSIITADSGTVASWYARHVQMRRGMMSSLSGGLATMGNAVPYAIAAKMAFSDRPVFALVGDGAMQMNGNAELLTAAAQRHKWKDQRLIVLWC